MRAIFTLFTMLGMSWLPAENEAFYRDLFATTCEGKTEVVLPDRTRCDVVTESHAIEVDFAHKWCEALGQGLWYGFQLNKKPGIVLILKEPKDRRFLYPLELAAYAPRAH